VNGAVATAGTVNAGRRQRSSTSADLKEREERSASVDGAFSFSFVLLLLRPVTHADTRLVQAKYQSRDVEGLERPRLIEMMAALIAEEEAGVVRAEAAVAAESDLENTGDVSDTERTSVAEMSLEERQLTLRETELEARSLEMEERR